MPTNYEGVNLRNLPVAVLPPSVEKRLARIEDLLLQMRSKQDDFVKRVAKAQEGLNALTEKSMQRADFGKPRQQSNDRRPKRR